MPRKAIKFTLKNAEKVFAEIVRQMKDNDGDKEMYVESVNAMLDDILCNDGFGTEGQMDPRGDHRE